MIILIAILSLFSAFFISSPHGVVAQSCASIPPSTGIATLITSTTEGTYRVWTRMKAGSSANNSFYLTIDNNCPILVGDSSQISTSSLTWVDYKDGNPLSKIDITFVGGAHALTLNGNEPGVAIDKIILTKDLSCVPTGSGDNCPAEPLSGAGPVISGVSATEITNASAKITWTLDRPSTGQVEYGTTTSYGTLSALESSFDYTTHVQSLSGLSTGTTYHYRVKSSDQQGNQSVSGDFTFTTTGGSGTLTQAPTPTSIPTPTKAPTATLTPTINPLTITSVNATNITQNGAKITWNLNRPATGQVEYGLTTSYGSLSKLEASFIYTNHAQQLSNLTPGKVYHYSVKSVDQQGNQAVSSDKTFTTTSQTLTLTPTADSFVRNSSPTTNYGKQTLVETDTSPLTVSYLKFNLAPLAGKTILKATLKFKVSEPSAQTQTLQNVNSSSWTETGLTYNNRPGFSGAITTFKAASTNSVVGLNIANAVNAKKGSEISLGITSAGDDRATYYSREASSGNRPVLVIEYK